MNNRVYNIQSESFTHIKQQLADFEAFSISWSQDAAVEEVHVSTISALTQDEKETKLVLFGDLTWSKLKVFLNLVEQQKVNIKGFEFSQPNKQLEGALIIYIDVLIDLSTKSKWLAWAEEQHIEFAYLHNMPQLSQPGLIVMDMDSTAIQIECIDEIAKLAGVGEQVSEVTAAAMRGELDFAESLRARVKTLTDAPVNIIDQVANNLPLMPGLENLVTVLKQHNWKIVIASGGFTYMTEKLKTQLDLDATVANQLEMHNGKLTGNGLGSIVDAQVKADSVRELAVEYGIPSEQTIAMGDGANDLVMMAEAALGVACHAKPLVRQKADVCVREGGLDQLLYLL